VNEPSSTTARRYCICRRVMHVVYEEGDRIVFDL
jgi:hypothetical protein